MPRSIQGLPGPCNAGRLRQDRHRPLCAGAIQPTGRAVLVTQGFGRRQGPELFPAPAKSTATRADLVPDRRTEKDRSASYRRRHRSSQRAENGFNRHLLCVVAISAISCDRRELGGLQGTYGWCLRRKTRHRQVDAACIARARSGGARCCVHTHLSTNPMARHAGPVGGGM